ncbi:hypothetical protein SAMN06265337_1615 [Hymenobacter gelipurpurascens]|uniref:Right handed beta helix region n=1 Tax=Hymenobacter gelipurpurascens TaxID=89968 RepID=A0A212TKT6_9BACT|nr:hypothetical protein [Hymenobacter gelipurpurascens]SNC66451.1 hypothetical protein SAMN06265337_1615 [Hymenobacter gelipurpurascens]
MKTHLRALPIGLGFLLIAGILSGIWYKILDERAILVITKGGTYTGNFRSTESGKPVVLIETTQLVILENCTLTGAGDIIQAANGQADLIVRNCTAYGLTPSEDKKDRGTFLRVAEARRLTVEHNYIEHLNGLIVYRWGGDGSAQQTMTVRYNSVKNLDARRRDGSYPRQGAAFVLLNSVRNLAGIDISFNQVINEPDQSTVFDNINFYNSSGTAQSWAKVHDNYVQGAYPFPSTSSEFSGSGMTTDGDGSTAQSTVAFLEAYNNQFVSTCNAAMNIAAGHDIYFHHNRMVTSGLRKDGVRLNSTFAAASIFNSYKKDTLTVFVRHRMLDNTIGYVRIGVSFPYKNRQDQDVTTGLNRMPKTGNNHLPNPITLATEQNEWTLWQQKLSKQGVQVGPLTRATVKAGYE